MRGLTARAIACALCWPGLALLAPPLQAQDFPVVFNSAARLRPLGLAINFATTAPPLKHKCFYYGEGGYLISASDEFYARFSRRGFSVVAMCLGLVSETRYDPETGRRLPSYVLTNPRQIRENMRDLGALEPGAISSELPLDLPDCFKNANPYGDCRFRFGRLTGKPLTPAQADAYRRLGAAIDQAMSRRVEGMPGADKFYGAGEGDAGIKGFRETSGRPLSVETEGAIADELLRYSSATIWVRSASLPRGYGYALDADGAAGPSVNPAALKAMIEQQAKPQVDPARLLQMLNANRP